MPKVEINDKQKIFLLKVAEVLENRDYNSQELHDRNVHHTKRTWIKTTKSFPSHIQNDNWEKQGPRATSFVLSLDKDFVIKRFRNES